MTSGTDHLSDQSKTRQIEEKLERALGRLREARPFAKFEHQRPVLELSRRLLVQPDGLERLYEFAPRLDEAGIFAGSDWDNPAALLPGLVSTTLQAEDRATVVLEVVSHLRLLAVAGGRHSCPGLSAEQAEHFLTQVLALNLNRLFGGGSEADRVRLGTLGVAVDELFQFLLSHIGFRDILSSLVDEIWRILAQRPIQLGHVKRMITEIAVVLARGAGDLGEARLGADRLISALFGPTQGCLEDPGLEVYRSRLAAMDLPTLQREALGFARAMHDTGLVSDYHAVFLRQMLEHGHHKQIPIALGLSSTGQDMLRCFPDLVRRLIADAVHPETAQTVYGLAMLLEGGVLHAPPIAPALWRQIGLTLSENSEATLAAVFGERQAPRVFLLAGVISVLGQPLGIGQGNNPTCQAARALSMWAHNDPDFLLHFIAQASRSDTILMHFEGRPINSLDLDPGKVFSALLDTDPVSTILVPHLDRVYNEMGRLCAQRGEDPHQWINPEFHGWWVGRGFMIAVDVPSGNLKKYDDFLHHFYANYHPFYNGDQPLIHPQPAGLAVTDSSAAFVGWHAITLLRVAQDQEQTMRLYFYNPNNDSGQNWGNGVVVSTQGHGERFGESSLPFSELASRLYIFHYDPAQEPQEPEIPTEEMEAVRQMAWESWAAERRGLES